MRPPLWFLALLGGATLLAAPGPTRAEGERVAIEERLRKSGGALPGGEAAALTRAQTQALFTIADDRAAAPTLRIRAVATVGLVRSAAAHDFLENLIIRKLPSSDPVDRALLRKAAVGLGWQAGPRVVDTLAPLLEHVDPEVRVDAAVALGLTRTLAAEEPLRDRLSREDDPAVRREIEQQLRLLTNRHAAAGK